MEFRYFNFTVFSNSYRDVSGYVERRPCVLALIIVIFKVMRSYGEIKIVTTQRYSLKNKNT